MDSSTTHYIFLMVERVSVIAILAVILTRWMWFRELLTYKPEPRIRILSVFLFSIIGIIGTYTGITVNPIGYDHSIGRVVTVSPAEAIINARVIGVAIGGILGGPLVGLASGVLAGAHRYTLGGFTAFACALATAWEGLLAGLLARYWFSEKSLSLWQVILIGILAEISQMLIILLVAKPFSLAWDLVEIIGVPMILANSAGLAIFFAIVDSVIRSEQEAVAQFAHTALAIADQTLPHLRKGLTGDSAQQTAQIIHRMTGVSAVALTDTQIILAFVGSGSDHHIVGVPLKTEATHFAIREGKAFVARDKHGVNCTDPDCPLTAAIVLPLRQRGEVIGTLKLYFESPAEITPSQIELVTGLANLFSTQLELARLDEQERLLADAEMKALLLQVNPHFLFNSLNTIVALIRKEPCLARQIANRLGQFLRRNMLVGNPSWRTLGEEINHIKDYLAIEEVRFRDKLSVHYEIQNSALAVPVPPLILLPLVENAIKHGISPLSRPGELWLTVSSDSKMAKVRVRDNGKGMDAERIRAVKSGKPPRAGIGGFGMYSVFRRMEGIYGSRASVEINSAVDQGTTVTLIFPAEMGKEQDRR